MLPTCLLDIVFDYSLQLRVHAVNCEIKRRMATFKAWIRPRLVERWIDWVDMDHPRALLPHVYGPEGDYQFADFFYMWWKD